MLDLKMKKIKVIDENGAPQVYYSILQYEDVCNLQGKLLTIIDACISEPKQNKAIKDIIKEKLWFEWVANLDGLNQTDEIQTGMPN